MRPPDIICSAVERAHRPCGSVKPSPLLTEEKATIPAHVSREIAEKLESNQNIYFDMVEIMYRLKVYHFFFCGHVQCR